MSKTTIAKKPKPEKPKTLGLFDHLNAIYTTKSPSYFNDISDGDKRSWSNYMIHRFISMNIGQIELANHLQKYSKLPPEMAYRFYCDVLPRGRQWNAYIKNKNVDKWDTQIVDYVVQYYECSKTEAVGYLNTMTIEQVKDICRKYGMSDKELKKLLP